MSETMQTRRDSKTVLSSVFLLTSYIFYLHLFTYSGPRSFWNKYFCLSPGINQCSIHQTTENKILLSFYWISSLYDKKRSFLLKVIIIGCFFTVSQQKRWKFFQHYTLRVIIIIISTKVRSPCTWLPIKISFRCI